MDQAGFYISINNNSQLPLTKFEGIKIPNGFATNVAIKKTHYSTLEPPYSSCRKDTEVANLDDSLYYNLTLKFTKYSQKLCFQICIQFEYIIRVCGCADASVPIMNRSVPLCSSWNDVSCVLNSTAYMNRIDLPSMCAKYCPLECDTQVFDHSISMTNYPTPYYYNVITKQSNLKRRFIKNGGNVSSETFEASVSLVNIYLDDLIYTKVEENPEITQDGVLGTIGKFFIKFKFISIS